MFKNLLSRLKSKIKSLFIKPKNIALHGIQRSGTNYINQYLLRLGVYVINYKGLKDCTHKHFRWYSNKHNIPSVKKIMDGEDILTADSLEQLNKICKYPNNMHHLVVIKNREKWIISILNWGIKCEWFDSVEDAITHVEEMIKDYDEYYRFWRLLQEKNPNNVHLVSLESVISNPVSFNELVSKICDLKRILSFDGRITEVPGSPSNRKNNFNDVDVNKIQSIIESMNT